MFGKQHSTSRSLPRLSLQIMYMGSWRETLTTTTQKEGEGQREVPRDAHSTLEPVPEVAHQTSKNGRPKYHMAARQAQLDAFRSFFEGQDTFNIILESHHEQQQEQLKDPARRKHTSRRNRKAQLAAFQALMDRDETFEVIPYTPSAPHPVSRAA